MTKMTKMQDEHDDHDFLDDQHDLDDPDDLMKAASQTIDHIDRMVYFIFAISMFKEKSRVSMTCPCWRRLWRVLAVVTRV